MVLSKEMLGEILDKNNYQLQAIFVETFPLVRFAWNKAAA